MVMRVADNEKAAQVLTQHGVKLITQEELDDKLISKKDFRVTVEDGVYFVEADWLLDILRTANMDDYSSLQYFQNVLRTSGIIDKLEEMGIEEGDTVSIFDFEFEYLR